MKAEKQKSLATLIKTLDTQVSLFVRLNAADDNGTVKCISCDEKLWYLDADCCHFIDRANIATRFHLPNLAPGCKDCNRYNPVWHLNIWETKLGETAFELRELGSTLMKYTRPELEEMILTYTEKVKELKKQKGL